MKWEYWMVTVDADDVAVSVPGGRVSLKEYLDQIGKQGWELVSACSHADTKQHKLYFKRPIQ